MRHRGQLVRGQAPPGALPPPRRTKDVAFGPSDFAGLWPARFVPDYWVNLHDGGVVYWLTPEDHPIVIPASTTTQTIIETDVAFDHFVVQTMSVVQATGGAEPLIDRRNFRLDCQRRDLGAQEQLDAGFVAFSSVFGTGRYPHPMAIPLVLSGEPGLRTMMDLRLTGLERLLLELVVVGMWVIPAFYAFTPWMDVADYRLPGWVGWLGAAVSCGGLSSMETR